MRRISFLAGLTAIVALGLGSAGASAQTEAESRITGLRLTGNEPIQIESDKLEVRENENIAIFSGNVSVTQGPTIAEVRPHDRLLRQGRRLGHDRLVEHRAAGGRRQGLRQVGQAGRHRR